MACLPAHRTKHIPVLSYPFRHAVFQLAQRDDGQNNGTALWLGAQCLSLYLAALYGRSEKHHKVVELGSGIGLTTLALCSLGCHVVATDIRPVISSVLRHNISVNSPELPGIVQVRELDWTVPPAEWTWDDPDVIASHCPPSAPPASSAAEFLAPPFDVICTADTVYERALVQPLLRSLHALCMRSLQASSRAPPVYLCIERRDPQLLDQALDNARHDWFENVVRIPHKKLTRALGKGGIKWARDDWEDIEIWKFTSPRHPEA